jgi:hypothetical protein
MEGVWFVSGSPSISDRGEARERTTKIGDRVRSTVDAVGSVFTVPRLLNALGGTQPDAGGPRCEPIA